MSNPSMTSQQSLENAIQTLQKTPEEMQIFLLDLLNQNPQTVFEILREMLKIEQEKTLTLIDNSFQLDRTNKFNLPNNIYQKNPDVHKQIEDFLKRTLEQKYSKTLQNKVNAIRVKLGSALTYEDHDLVNAYNNFEKVHKQEQNNSEAIYGMAYCKTYLKEFPTAGELFDQYEKLAKVEPPSWWHRGYCCIQLSQFEKAYESFQKYLDNTPEDSYTSEFRIIALNYKGYSAAQLNDLDLANKIFDEVLSISRYDFGAAMGKSLVTQKRNFLDEKKKLIKSTQKHLEELFEEIPSGLRNVGRMYTIQFGIGVFFILLAIILAAVGVNTLVSGISGLSGAAISIMSLVNKAPVDLQRNRVNSAQWMIAYYNWINALYNVSAVTDHLTNDHKKINWAAISPLQDYLTEVTNKTIMTMKQYCVYSEGTTDDTKTKNKHAKNVQPTNASQ